MAGRGAPITEATQQNFQKPGRGIEHFFSLRAAPILLIFFIYFCANEVEKT